MIRLAARLAGTALLAAALAGCTSEIDPALYGRGIGDFRLEHMVVIVEKPAQGPLSRKVQDATIKAAVSEAMNARLHRFKGGGEYSVGIKVVGYVLAAPGIPVLLAPRSMLLMNVNVYDAKFQRLNEDTKHMTVFEDAGGDTVFGSGYTQTAEEQLAELSRNAAIEVEKWLRENPDWFRPAAEAADPDAAALPEAPAAPVAAAAPDGNT